MPQIERPKNLLFVCSENISRSPTAQSLMRASEWYNARSAGISPMSPTTVDEELLEWADIVFVMSEGQDGHASYLRDRYGLPWEKILDLDIPDRYARSDPELLVLLKKRIASAIPLDF